MQTRFSKPADRVGWKSCNPRGLMGAIVKLIFFSLAWQPLGGLGRLIFRSFTITLRHTTLGRTPLDEWSARRRDLYLTTHNTHKRQTSMSPVGFFFSVPLFPFDPFLYCLNPLFVLHVTLRSMLPSLYNKHNTNIHAPGGIRTRNPSKRAAAGTRLRLRGHRDPCLVPIVN
jgi:hypothetical protein